MAWMGRQKYSASKCGTVSPSMSSHSRNKGRTFLFRALKKADVIAMMESVKGATLAEILEAMACRRTSPEDS
jgi:hypothetical protein